MCYFSGLFLLLTQSGPSSWGAAANIGMGLPTSLNPTKNLPHGYTQRLVAQGVLECGTEEVLSV